jgi:hypothetical protein
MSLRAIVAAAFWLCVASLAYIFFSARLNTAPASGSFPARAPAATIDTTPRVGTAFTAPGGSSPPAAQWSPQDSPAVAARRWRDAADKRAFYDRALETGGGAYLHYAGKSLAACAAVNRLGVIGAEQRFASSQRADDPTLPRRIEAFRASIAGCEGFEARAVPAEDEAALFQRLLSSPDLVGRIYATKLWALTGSRGDEARAVLRQTVETRDAELLALVYPALVAREFASPDTAPKTEDIQNELDAWRWALCELGTDCSPASAYGRALCSGGGLCEWRRVDEIAAAAFPGANAERKDEIVARVRAGDWTKLGL